MASQYKKRNKLNAFDWRKCSSYTCRVYSMVIISFILLMAAMTLIYFLLKKTSQKSDEIIALPKTVEWIPRCAEHVPVTERFNCFPENPNVSEMDCIARGCCYLKDDIEEEVVKWNMSNDLIPNCVFPKNYGYKVSGKPVTRFNGFEVPLERLPAVSRYGDDLQFVRLHVEFQTSYRLRIKIYSQNSQHYEVPSPSVPTDPDARLETIHEREIYKYSVTYSATDIPFSFKVRRTDSDVILFDTSVGSLTLSHHFLELSTRLPSADLYGLGEHSHNHLRHDMKYQTWSLFSNSPKKTVGGVSGVHPMYMCMEPDGKAHGLLLLNSNALEIVSLPLPALTFRTIGGILDFYFFLGPSPDDVIRQYTEAVGRPMMPPYWALGLHIHLHGYNTVNDLDDFMKNNEFNRFPADVVNLHIDTVQHYSSNSAFYRALKNITNDLHAKGQKLMLTMEPYVKVTKTMSRNSLYHTGLHNGVFVMDKWGLEPIHGKIGNSEVVYPDYGSSVSLHWLANLLNNIYAHVKFDGLFLVRNQPYSEIDGAVHGCMNDDLNRPHYIPAINGKKLYSRTLCMDARLHWMDDLYTHYDLHNIYGYSMSVTTENALKLFLKEKRILLLSQSTFVGSGRYVGHSIENINGTWSGLNEVVPAIINFNLFGIPFVGVNIWNNVNQKNSSEELCLRWFQLGVFLPFSHVYNSAFMEGCKLKNFRREFRISARHAIMQRYELLPYLYTLFHMAHNQGSAVIRPLFYEFPDDNETYSIKEQFMWGSALLISPILETPMKNIKYYLPEGMWYNFYTNIPLYSNGEWFREDDVVYYNLRPAILHCRAGHIITLQQPSNTTTKSRLNPMKLIVALNSNFEASGILYWDDGETKDSFSLGEYIIVNYVAMKNTLLVNGTLGNRIFQNNFYTVYVQEVKILGLPTSPKKVIIDKTYVVTDKQKHWNVYTKVLELKHILIPLERKTEIKWHF